MAFSPISLANASHMATPEPEKGCIIFPWREAAHILNNNTIYNQVLVMPGIRCYLVGVEGQGGVFCLYFKLTFFCDFTLCSFQLQLMFFCFYHFSPALFIMTQKRNSYLYPEIDISGPMAQDPNTCPQSNSPLSSSTQSFSTSLLHQF